MSSASDVIMSGGAANAHLLDGSVEWRDVPRRIGYYAKVLLFGRRDSSGSAGSFFFLNLEDAAGLFEASGAEFDAVARFRGRLLPSQRLEEHPVWKSGDDKTVLISIFGVVHEDVTSWQLSMTMRLAQAHLAAFGWTKLAYARLVYTYDGLVLPGVHLRLLDTPVWVPIHKGGTTLAYLKYMVSFTPANDAKIRLQVDSRGKTAPPVSYDTTFSSVSSADTSGGSTTEGSDEAAADDSGNRSTSGTRACDRSSSSDSDSISIWSASSSSDASVTDTSGPADESDSSTAELVYATDRRNERLRHQFRHHSHVKSRACRRWQARPYCSSDPFGETARKEMRSTRARLMDGRRSRETAKVMLGPDAPGLRTQEELEQAVKYGCKCHGV